MNCLAVHKTQAIRTTLILTLVEVMQPVPTRRAVEIDSTWIDAMKILDSI